MKILTFDEIYNFIVQIFLRPKNDILPKSVEN
jgi:hypothetical protein